MRRLFVSYVKGFSRDICKDITAGWIRSLFNLAYEKCSYIIQISATESQRSEQCLLHWPGEPILDSKTLYQQHVGQIIQVLHLSIWKPFPSSLGAFKVVSYIWFILLLFLFIGTVYILGTSCQAQGHLSPTSQPRKTSLAWNLYVTPGTETHLRLNAHSLDRAARQRHCHRIPS